MKRFLAILVLVLLVVSSAAAEDIDLSGLSFDQLVQLQSRITMEMMQRDEWQEVTVPAGVYMVGRDIPAGKWEVTATQFLSYLTYGKELKEDNKNEVAHTGHYTWKYCKEGEPYIFEFEDGYYVQLDDAMIFKPVSAGSLFKFN